MILKDTDALIATPKDSSDTSFLDPERFPTLAKVGIDLTARAQSGALDPLVGRESELDAVLDILGRRRSNNPVLVGESGVGKTAIALGLAHRLLKEEGPLKGKILVELSAGSLVRGMNVRGALAERIENLRAELEAAAGQILLFIDEVHMIVGAESGPDNIAGALKAGLANGDLCCIGATTDAEYRRSIERDPALARRFSIVRVPEPSIDDTVQILKGLRARYAAHHRLEISDDALIASARLAARYLPEQRLPDKAIGVLDLACARASRRGGTYVDLEGVAAVIAERAKVPAERLMLRDGKRLMGLETLLSNQVIGQPEPVQRIAESLRKSAAGFVGKRPLGTFLFLGPTGVGKTEMAKAISEVFFPGTALSRFDMSELSERHGVARLFGAPPGYIGHDDGGQLTEALRRQPYQLVLLDEIEKAHPDVLLSLLPLLDEGRITDGRGRTVNATNAIIVMTSNLGAAAATRRSIGFGEEAGGQHGALDAVRRALPPELFNRIDEPLYFRPLEKCDVHAIARRFVDGAVTTMAKQNIRVHYDDQVLQALIDGGGFDEALGARPMRRIVGREIEARLARGLLAGDFESGDSVRLALVDGVIRANKATPRVRLRTPA